MLYELNTITLIDGWNSSTNLAAETTCTTQQLTEGGVITTSLGSDNPRGKVIN